MRLSSLIAFSSCNPLTPQERQLMASRCEDLSNKRVGPGAPSIRKAPSREPVSTVAQKLAQEPGGCHPYLPRKMVGIKNFFRQEKKRREVDALLSLLLCLSLLSHTLCKHVGVVVALLRDLQSNAQI